MPESPGLPIRIRSSVEALLVAARMHVKNSRLSLAYATQRVLHIDLPILIAADDGIVRDLAEVAFRHQVLQGLGGLLLVVRVIVNDRSQREEVVAQDALLGADERLLVDRDRDRDQNPDDGNDDQNLDQREAARFTIPSTAFHRLPS